jgi:hypothetical protein
MYEFMAATTAAAPDQTLFSAWRRDYRLSLALLIAGVVLVVAYFAFGVWGNSTGYYPATFGADLAINLSGSAGGALILLAGTVAYYHRKGLRRFQGNA